MQKKENENNYLYSIGPYAKKKKMKNFFLFNWTMCTKRKMKKINCTQ